MSFIAIIHIIYIITIMSFLQLRVELWIADHVWQEKHDAIAMTVNSLGDEFKPAMRAGWGWRTSARPIQMGQQLL